MEKLLLKNGWILTMDDGATEYRHGYLCVEGEKITRLGDMEELAGLGDFADWRVVDCTDKIITPGMVNTHSHLPMVVFRSLADDVADRLKRYLFPLEKTAMDRGMARDGAAYAFAELISGGVTTVYDAYYFEEEIAREAERCGIRAVLSETILNFPSPSAAEPYGGIDYTRKFLKNWAGHRLITPAVNCHAIYSNDAEHLKECHALAREYDTTFCMHLAEMDYEQRDCLAEHGCTPVAYLDRLGVLDERFLAAHCINMEDGDLAIFRERGVKVSHNVGSNAKAGKGVARVREMVEMGITVGLGSDGAMSGNTLDILTQLSLVGKIQKVHNHDRTIFPARQILRLATIGGARALGLGEVTGSLEVGKAADLLIFETESVNMQPIFDPYSVIVYSANPANVESTMVAGQFLMEKRKLLTLNLPKVRENLLTHREKIAATADDLDRKAGLK